VNFSIVIDNMRAQGCDEAANMSDIHRSVQSTIREGIQTAQFILPLVVYSHI